MSFRWVYAVLIRFIHVLIITHLGGVETFAILPKRLSIDTGIDWVSIDHLSIPKPVFQTRRGDSGESAKTRIISNLCSDRNRLLICYLLKITLTSEDFGFWIFKAMLANGIQ